MTSQNSPRLRSTRPLRVALAGAALLFVSFYAFIAARRAGYPFELEWIEGGSLAQVRRILHGQPLYVAPSLEFVPFNYTPLYFYVSSWAARAWGDGFLSLRLVSILASVACMVLLFTYVLRETRSRFAALLSTGLWCATYRIGGGWLDVARADSLHLALLLAGFWVLRFDGSRYRAPLVAGVLLSLAFLTKQSALVVCAPMLALLLATQRARFAILAGTLALLVVGGTIALDASSHGWFSYYVFKVPGGHKIDPSLIPLFWSRDLLGPLAIAILVGFAGLAIDPDPESRTDRGLALAVAAGLVLCSWSLRVFPGGYDNVLLPAHLAIALLFGLGWGALERATAALKPPASKLAAWIPVICMLQFAVLLYNPMRLVPRAEDVAAGRDLVEKLRRSAGTLLVSSHEYLLPMAGKPEHFHVMPFMDVVKSGNGTVERRLLEDLRDALRTQKYSLIVLDGRDWLSDEVEPYYTNQWAIFDQPRVFWPMTGMKTRPEFVYVPKPL